MRIESVAVKNLRCIKDGVAYFDAYTCMVGPNGAGKSTFLHALNIFFRHIEDTKTDVTSLTSEDFHLHDTTNPIEITVTFADLSQQAAEDFKGYVRQGKLIVSSAAAFDGKSNRAEVKQYGQRLGMTAFKPFFKAYGDDKPAADLKAAFDGLEKEIPELAAKKSKKTRDAMYQTLRDFEAERPDQCEVIPSEDQFYGVSKGANRLEKYVQWIFIPAVKDATEEQSETKTGALGKLLARTVRAKVNFSATVDALIAQASFGMKDGVWATVPRHVPSLVAALRLTLEEVAQTKRAVASKNETVEALFNYLTGPEFAHRVEAIMRAFIGMKEELEEEKRVTTRRWAKREKQLELVVGNTSGMYGDLQGLIGTSLKPIAALEPAESDRREGEAGLTLAAEGEESV